MCELLGMSFNKPIGFQLSFSGFSRRGIRNPHGWGVGLYPDGGPAAQVIKEPLEMRNSGLAGYIRENGLRHSKIVLSHVRYATENITHSYNENQMADTILPKVSYANTHPFIRELNGVEYMFAHNGSLHGLNDGIPLGKFLPVGRTDSEYAFCYIMEQLASLSAEKNTRLFASVELVMRKINEFGSFNSLMADGEFLYVYRDKNQYNCLYSVQRKAPHLRRVKLIDDDYQVDFEETKDASESGYIIATKPLTDEPWKELSPGQLYVYQNGQCIYPSEQRILSDIEMLFLLFHLRKSEHAVHVKDVMNLARKRIEQIEPLVREILASGEVKVDSRYESNPYDLNASFYTISSRRSKIDIMLKQHANAVYLPLPQTGSVNDGHENVFVCLDCLQNQKAESMFCTKCGNSLISLDEGIAWSIIELNRKHYKTSYCCTGHYQELNRTYIVFGSNVEGLSTPIGFQWGKHSSRNTLRHIPYKKAMAVPMRDVRDVLSIEERIRYQQDGLMNLEAWVKELPIRQ